MKKVILSVLSCILLQPLFAQVRITDLTAEHQIAPLGLVAKHPRLSWKIISGNRDFMQAAYEIQISSTKDPSKGDAWSTGKVMSDKSVNITYQGQELKSAKHYFWRLRVWNKAGNASDWSERSWWTTGFINSSDWTAKWIESGLPGDSVLGPCPMFRRTFEVKKIVNSARLYITAHGLYEASVNGQRVGDAYFTPGWTSYKTRLQYQVYDVTASMKEGVNVIGVVLGDGWYRGHLAWKDNKNIYGKAVGLLAQLQLVYADGTSETIVSDDQWKTSTGPILKSSIYHGETYDAQLEKSGWNRSSYDASKWQSVKVNDVSKENLIATDDPLVTKHETFKAIKVITTPKGEKVLDFGQNLVGWVQFKVTGKKGDVVSIHHAEVLDKTGNFYTENLRIAKAEVQYSLKGGGEETFEPHFTFFGFRYIKVDGYPGELNTNNFKAITLYSDIKQTGNFECSNSLVNQLQHNIQWGQRGNFLDVPTDCPQRDERLGWTGDAQAFARTASFNFGIDDFFEKWMKDLAADQQPDGRVPFVVPNVLSPTEGGSAGWSDAATIIPWTMYLAYGDKKILEDQYESMKLWIAFIQANSTNDLWNKGFHFGDWLFYRPFDDNDGRSAVTDKYLIAQTFYSYSIDLVVKTASVLGKKDDVAKFTALSNRIKKAFLNEYVTPNGRLVSSTQTAYVLALNFDMLPEAQRKQAADYLVQNIKSYDYHLTTGFLGTPYLCHVLTRFGYTDVAYQLLLQESYPSWLYPVKMGATTIWERWDGIKPDGTFQTPGMNSFNHYAYGAIGDWLYRAVTGIDTYEDGAGYKHIKLQPHTGGGLTFANADLQTQYGNVSSRWKIENGNFNWSVEVPANTFATIYVPATTANEITESGKAISSMKEIKVSGSENNAVILQIGSGRYVFSSKLK